jgi:serine/threonine protein kinase
VKLDSLTTTQLNQLLEHSQIIEKDAYGAKVAITGDGLFLKILRRKKSWKANEVAKIKRFCANADELHKRQIPTLVPKQIIQIAEQHKAAVIYQPLDGTPLRKALAAMTDEQCVKTIRQLAGFIHTLHQRGIYFRSLHADNILINGDDEFGLIDILDMQFSRKPLSIFKRTRNFSHLFRLNNLAPWHGQIIRDYIEAAGLSGWKKGWLLRQVHLA